MHTLQDDNLQFHSLIINSPEPAAAMGRRHLLYLLFTSSSRPPSSPPYFTAPPPPLPLPFRKCWKGYRREIEAMNHERAPSTLEEFKRLEEEKAGRQLEVEKGKDGTAMEAVVAGVKELADVGNTPKAGDSQTTK